MPYPGEEDKCSGNADAGARWSGSVPVFLQVGVAERTLCAERADNAVVGACLS
jgi:hypothetical protein